MKKIPLQNTSGPKYCDKGHQACGPSLPSSLGCLHLPSSSHLLFCRDVAIHQGDAFHTSHLDMRSNVTEFQAQVLPSDGDFGAPLPRACHWDDLQEEEELLCQAPWSITVYLVLCTVPPGGPESVRLALLSLGKESVLLCGPESHDQSPSSIIPSHRRRDYSCSVTKYFRENQKRFLAQNITLLYLTCTKNHPTQFQDEMYCFHVISLHWNPKAPSHTFFLTITILVQFPILPLSPSSSLELQLPNASVSLVSPVCLINSGMLLQPSQQISLQNIWHIIYLPCSLGFSWTWF